MNRVTVSHSCLAKCLEEKKYKNLRYSTKTYCAQVFALGLNLKFNSKSQNYIHVTSLGLTLIIEQSCFALNSTANNTVTPLRSAAD